MYSGSGRQGITQVRRSQDVSHPVAVRRSYGRHGIFLYILPCTVRVPPRQVMPIFLCLIFTVDRWRARGGLRDSPADATPQKQNEETQRGERFEGKEKARRRGLLGETYGYWYLRR